jgi:hypothetical protein
MLCEITLEEACVLAGTHGKTTTKKLKRVLHAMSVKHAERRKRGWPDKNETALLFFQSKDRKLAHWVLYHRRKYYDPNAGVFRQVPRYLKDTDMTSHLKVWP